ncbi:MAG TPA: M10 family metallopeptidase C-terminal domain-containing protein, partial [Allosphingosinicella sp.]
MADKPNITKEGYVTALVQTGFWATPQNPIQYAFLEQKPAYMGNMPAWAAYSPAQRAAVERAFAVIAEVVNLTFVQVADNQQQPGPANPRIAFYANTADLSFSGSMLAYRVNEGPAIHGADIRFNTARIAQRQANEGHQDFTSFVGLHEVLHAMGLSHPGNYNGQGPTYQNDAEFVEDTTQYSVMSYFGAANTGADHTIGSVLYSGRTPLLYDILALHSLYSPNMTTRAGDTVYGFNSNTGASSPFNFAVTTGPVVAIWDGGGIDTIDLSGYGEASLIDLNEGAFSDAGGLTRNIAIAFNVTIENAVGGAGADRLVGNAAANRLDGGAGADQMEGGPGNDLYAVDDHGDVVVEHAGAGTDEVRTALAAYALTTNVENLTGTSASGQTLTGNGLANGIVTGGGNDILDGGAGADGLAGGHGNDVYVVDGGDIVHENPDAGTDEVRTALGAYALTTDVENLTGTSASGQALTGNGLANGIVAGAGNDILDGGAGADGLSGGLGNDVYVVDAGDIVYENPDAGTDEVRTALGAYALSTNVENLTGTSGSGQTLIGNGLANGIVGGSGNDILDGGAGVDGLSGGLGNDVYVVDAGDIVHENPDFGTDEVRTALAAYALTADVEILIGTSAAGQTLIGNGLANGIVAGGGNDILDGGAGADGLSGGFGNDVYIVDAGDIVYENHPDAGTDEVRTALAVYVLATDVENLTGTSGSGQTLIGNGLA